MKTVVIYKSKSGYVKRYAEMIAKELSADLVEHSKAKPETLMGYDAIVYGGGLYVGGINGVKLIKDNLGKLAGKRIAVFATGASPASREAREDVIKHNFTAEQLEKLQFFYLRGGFDYSKLTLRDKFLMTLLKMKIKRKIKRNIKLVDDEVGMLAAYNKPVDFVKRKNIEGLIQYIVQ